jgi:hypothetical protein
LVRVHHAIVGVNTGQVDLADELNCGRLVGVVETAVHLDAVDAVLMNGLKREVLVTCEYIDLSLGVGRARVRSFVNPQELT